MTKKENYIYDELKDQFIVESVKNDFQTRMQERKNIELAWELNMNFFVGNQYCYVSNTSEISDIEKKYYWENREVYNHIAPIIEARLAKLSKISTNLNVRPSSATESDFYSSKLAKLILQNVIDKNELNKLVATATFWSEITGTAFYKITWENDSGEIVGNDNGKEIKNGDVKISVCSPFEIYPDSNDAWDIDDCNSIIEARAFPVDYVNEKFGKLYSGKDIDMYELGGNSFLSGMSGRSNVTRVSHCKKHNQVLIIERYEKPSKSHPNGRLTIVCENDLLYDGELPYIVGIENKRGFPFVKQISSRQIGSFWGSSVIDRCIPVQRAYNAIKNKKHEFIERLASGILTVEDGSVDTDSLENEGLEPGKILIYRSGSTPPKFLEAGSIPKELEDEEEKLIEELNVLSSTSDMMISSSVPSNLNSGSALSVLIEQDNSRLSIAGENIRSALVSIGKLVLRLYKQFATKPRLYKISDSTGTLQVAYWNNNDIASDDVILETNNELGESISKIKDSLLELYEKGLLSDENGVISSATKNKILSLFGLNSFNIFDDTRELHKTKASKENFDIDRLNEPLEIDDHAIHIAEHTRFLICDDSKNISEAKKDKLLEHIRKHKKMM